MSKIILNFKAFFLKPFVYVYFIVSLLIYGYIIYNARSFPLFAPNIYLDTEIVLFGIPTYAAISGILGRLYIKNFYTSFLVFCFFWSITLIISYIMTDPHYEISALLLFVLIAYAVAYTFFYTVTFAISYIIKNELCKHP